MALLAISSQLLKVNGNVHQQGVHYLRKYIARNFSQSYANDRIVVLRTLLEKKYNVSSLSKEIAASTPQKFRDEFLGLLYRMAIADGHLSSIENTFLQRVCVDLNLPIKQFRQVKRWSPRPASDPYSLLGLNPNAADSEVKKAYRVMVLKYHPDRQSDKNASSRENFEEIRLAYEAICLERNIK